MNRVVECMLAIISLLILMPIGIVVLLIYSFSIFGWILTLVFGVIAGLWLIIAIPTGLHVIANEYSDIG